MEVDEDGYKQGLTLDGIPDTAADFGACMRIALREMPIAEEPLQEGVKELKFARTHAGDSQDALRRFIEVILGVPIVTSELVVQADGHTVLLPVTIKVVDTQVKPIDLDKRILEQIGRQALDSLGYDEIIRQAKQQGWVKTVRKTQPKAPAGKALIGQSETEVVVVMFEVFTEYAVTAGVVSQLDSPLPGPADLAAIGIMAMAIYKVGAIAIDALSTATAPAPTSRPSPPPPPPPPRRWPNQTCENKRLDELEDAKKKACASFPGKSCSESKVSKKLLAKYPCSVIKARIVAVGVCAAARRKVQDECFKGSPEPGHDEQIDNHINGIRECEALKLVNCAPGHPMSGL